MKKTILRILSYILVAAVASAATLFLSAPVQEAPTKLDQLEDLILERFIGEADVTAMEDGAAAGMIDSLGDRWSYYIPAADYQEYQEQMANAYVGVGITITVREDMSGFDVTKVEPKGPAAEAGIRVGDLLVAANGQRVGPLGLEGSTAIIKGEEGTTVDLTVLRDGVELTFTVERRLVETEVATARMLEANIGLVTIFNFDSRCASETLAAIEALLEEGAQALIFDVRFNPGGYKDELVEILDYLLPEGDLFVSEEYTNITYVDTSDAECLDIPMAVIVNAESYSAAEFFAAALQEYEAAIIVGQQTVGKGYYQTSFRLSDGSAVGLSIGRYCTPKGVSLEGVGITPDIPVEVDEETAAAIYALTLEPEEDPQIQAAVEALLAG